MITVEVRLEGCGKWLLVGVVRVAGWSGYHRGGGGGVLVVA